MSWSEAWYLIDWESIHSFSPQVRVLRTLHKQFIDQFTLCIIKCLENVVEHKDSLNHWKEFRCLWVLLMRIPNVNQEISLNTFVLSNMKSYLEGSYTYSFSPLYATLSPIPHHRPLPLLAPPGTN